MRSGLEKAVEQLKSEGVTEEEIRDAFAKIKREVREQSIITDSLDEYLDNVIAEDCELCDGMGRITQADDDTATYVHYGSVTCECVKGVDE